MRGRVIDYSNNFTARFPGGQFRSSSFLELRERKNRTPKAGWHSYE